MKIVTKGDEQMVLFPSYAKRHVRGVQRQPRAGAVGGSDEHVGGGVLAPRMDQERGCEGDCRRRRSWVGIRTAEGPSDETQPHHDRPGTEAERHPRSTTQIEQVENAPAGVPP